MESNALANTPPIPVTQRELLGLIMGCAVRTSATFNQAEFAVAVAGGGPDRRALTRELLTDLAIRGWIELRACPSDASEQPIERRLWAFELASNRNWKPERSDRARYALTDRGRSYLLRTDGR